MAEDAGFEPADVDTPLAFRASPVQPLRANPPYAEGAGIEPAHDVSRDLGLANRRLTARPTFRSARRIRTDTVTDLNRVPLPLG
jgi:hypothetical protein